MTKESLLRRLTEEQDLPTPPAVALQVLEKINQSECRIGDLAKVICLDPALSGRILKVVNSAFYGLPGQIAIRLRE